MMIQDRPTQENSITGYRPMVVFNGQAHDWPEHSRIAAFEMIDKFGAPDVMSSQVIIWKRDSECVVVEKNLGLIGRAS